MLSKSVAVRAALALAAAAGSAFGQASFVENFDAMGSVGSGQHGPSDLIARGFVFRNQSNPTGFGYWYEAAGYSQAGAACLTVNGVTQWVNSSSMGSSWMILPAIPGQQSGDPIRFWLQDGYMTAGMYGVMEVRYSPGGGTGTGSGPTGTGDFSQVLLSIPNVNGRGWTSFATAAPGPGRIAFRFVTPAGSASYLFNANFSIDSLVVGTEPGLAYPLPLPGQTVHWTMAHSPVVIDYDREIPAGGTVVVDPGVEVRIAPTMKLHVNGTIDAREGTTFTVPVDAQMNINGTALFNGTAASRVRLEGGPAWFGGDMGYQVKYTGHAVMNHVDLNALVKTATYIYLTGGGRIEASDVTVTQPECGFYIDRGTLALRDSSFTAGVVHLVDSYLLVDRLTLNSAKLISERYNAGQTILLDNIAATGAADDAPFLLRGFDHFFGQNNTISGNLFPVHLNGGGVARGSTLPAAGNVHNMIHGGECEIVGRSTFANVGLDYRVDYPGNNNTWLGGHLTVDPGVTVRFGPGAYFWATFGSKLIAKGLPEAPITFTRLEPTEAWQTVDYSVNFHRPILEHCIFEGGMRALVADETVVRVRDCEFRNNDVASRSVNYLYSEIRKSRFFDNGIGAQAASNSGFELDGGLMPNHFEGNGIGAENQDVFNYESATGNYWGSPSGPAVASNPGGTGDPIAGFIHYQPFRASPPNFADKAPIVRVRPASFLNEEGRKILLTWDAADDGQIVAQRIEWAPHDECAPGLSVLVPSIPAGARAWEVVIPAYGISNCIDPAVLRVVSVDNAGQEGYDEVMYNLPRASDPPAPVPLPIAGTLRPGQTVQVCTTGGSYFDAVLFLDGDEWSFSLGGTTTNCLSGGMHVPPVSTDLARIGLRNGNAWSFTPYFSIRPDPAIGDAPPVVSMLTPTAGQSLAGGSVVPITWSASDDEGMRSFDIHASYDGGRTWHMIMKDLPGPARSFDWQLPPSTGIADVRVRVVGRDLRFQNSSSGGDRALSIAPGTGPAGCYANCDGSTLSPVLNVNDFTCFLNRFAAGEAYANCDGSTTAPVLNVNDFTCFLNRFAAGCR